MEAPRGLTELPAELLLHIVNDVAQHDFNQQEPNDHADRPCSTALLNLSRTCKNLHRDITPLLALYWNSGKNKSAESTCRLLQHIAKNPEMAMGIRHAKIVISNDKTALMPDHKSIELAGLRSVVLSSDRKWHSHLERNCRKGSVEAWSCMLLASMTQLRSLEITVLDSTAMVTALCGLIGIEQEEGSSMYDSEKRQLSPFINLKTVTLTSRTNLLAAKGYAHEEVDYSPELRLLAKLFELPALQNLTYSNVCCYWQDGIAWPVNESNIQTLDLGTMTLNEEHYPRIFAACRQLNKLTIRIPDHSYYDLQGLITARATVQGIQNHAPHLHELTIFSENEFCDWFPTSLESSDPILLMPLFQNTLHLRKLSFDETMLKWFCSTANNPPLISASISFLIPKSLIHLEFRDCQGHRMNLGAAHFLALQQFLANCSKQDDCPNLKILGVPARLKTFMEGESNESAVHADSFQSLKHIRNSCASIGVELVLLECLEEIWW